MSSKKNFLVVLESQVDKIVLVVIVLISLVLLWLYVVGNPYAQKVGAKNLSPGEIDKKIKQDADRLLEELDELPSDEYTVYKETHLSDFERLMQCPISNISSDLVVQFPGVGDAIIEEDRLYDVPFVPALNEVQMATLRGAARVPVDEVGPANPYQNAVTKLADMDQVTISGRFDVQSLYNNFRLSFDNPGLKSSWKDPKLAIPVFAKMELQRREKLEDGSWSDWQEVPRTKIDTYQKLLEQLPLNPDEMQFGVNVWMSQFQNPDVQLDILQPVSYQFEISKNEWMPPQFLNEVREIVKKQQEEEKRELREQRQKANETPARGGDRRTGNRGGGGTRERRPTRERQPQQNRRDPMMGLEGDRDRLATPTRATREKERTEKDVERDVKGEMLSSVKRLEATRDPILVWAHDDTTSPGRTYQYRIRLGVFNPIMGKDWFKQSQAEFKNQTVLWSRYSEPTEEIKVAKMLHVFPVDTIKGESEAVEGAKIEVAKYHMGQWQSYAFDTFPGQIIGKSVTMAELAEQRDDSRSRNRDETDVRMMNPNQPQEEEKIDFTTSMVMVDVLKDLNWGTRIKRDAFYQMLYYEKAGIVEIPIGKTYWSKDVKSDYEMIQDAMEEEVDSRGFEDFGRRGMPRGMDEMMF